MKLESRLLLEPALFLSAVLAAHFLHDFLPGIDTSKNRKLISEVMIPSALSTIPMIARIRPVFTFW